MAKLYGIGVGPGDPELMTLKAVRLISESDVIVLPSSGQTTNVAYTIAAGAVPEIKKKNLLELEMPMTRNHEILEKSHKNAATQIGKLLENGKTVSFLTLGDPTIYSTYCYVHDRVKELGYDAEIIPGIPSFCAAAARLGISLTEASETLCIIPSSYDIRSAAMEIKGTKVLMKSGKSIGDLKKELVNNNERWEVKMVERCGMEGERVFTSAEEIPDESSYFSTVIVKEKIEDKNI